MKEQQQTTNNKQQTTTNNKQQTTITVLPNYSPSVCADLRLVAGLRLSLGV
jgi:hypothetical protein